MSAERSFDAVVVGGGVFGCSAALHLARAGVGDVLLLERGGIGEATSNAGGGFVAMWAAGNFPGWGQSELDVERYGLDFYEGLDEEGLDLDLRRNGNLWIAASDRGWESFVRPLAEHPAVADKEVIDGAQVAELTGVVDGEEALRAVYHPSGIQVSAPHAATAMARSCRAAGGTVTENEPVAEIMVEGDHVAGVMTSSGPVSAGVVVVAAGAWTTALLAEVGYEAPMVPLTATRLTSEESVGVPESCPTMSIDEFSFLWVRGDHGRLLWGCDYTASPHFDFVESEPPPELERLEGDAVGTEIEVGKQAARLIPLLGEERGYQVDHGAPCYTADMRSLLGPVPGIEGLYAMGGDNQAGVTHAPGYGKLISEMVVDGAAALTDSTPFRLERFSEPVDRREIAEAATEAVFFA